MGTGTVDTEHHMGTGTVDMSCVTLSHVLSRGSHFYWHIRSSKILLLILHKKLTRIIDVPLWFVNLANNTGEKGAIFYKA